MNMKAYISIWEFIKRTSPSSILYPEFAKKKKKKKGKKKKKKKKKKKGGIYIQRYINKLCQVCIRNLKISKISKFQIIITDEEGRKGAGAGKGGERRENFSKKRKKKPKKKKKKVMKNYQGHKRVWNGNGNGNGNGNLNLNLKNKKSGKCQRTIKRMYTKGLFFSFLV